jgi:transketolase
VRNALCSSLVAHAADPDFVFLTGDLGFQALEPLREAMGARFINAGVAEQNMISVAAGLARSGLRPWAYSIAPFIYARPFEQIRNDVCQHRLPVRLVGNGGGFAYGVMGGTHHALEDYGVLLCLSHMRALVPAFDSDVSAMVDLLQTIADPAYLRLGRSEQPNDWPVPPYAPWRRLLPGERATLLVVGPLVGSIVALLRDLAPADRPDLWVLCELPIDELPDAFLDSVERSQHLVVVEEHGARGGAGELIARELLLRGHAPARFSHHHARGYPSGRYGSQSFHRAECGLDPESVVRPLLAAERRS